MHDSSTSSTTVSPFDRTALLVIDIQRGGAMGGDRAGIALMEGHSAFISAAESAVSIARAAKIPLIFFQEVHRPSGVDIGRELDGTETMHCVEGDLATELWPTLQPQAGEELIRKRRYSCFLGTELEILLRGLGINTVVLIGTLTDVCVHYTFADAHQRDLYVRVVGEATLGSSITAHDGALAAMSYLQRDALITLDDLAQAVKLTSAEGSR